MYNDAGTLALDYRVFCAENEIRGIYVADVDRTAVLHQSARVIAKKVAKEAYRAGDYAALEIGAKGALETIYHMILGNETAGFKSFKHALEKAGVTEEEIMRYSLQTVWETKNPKFIKFLNDVRKVYEDAHEKPVMLIKTTGLKEVADALKAYISPAEDVFEIHTIGNPYPDDFLTITEETQIDYIKDWIKDNTEMRLSDAVLVDDRDMFEKTNASSLRPYRFVASNKAPRRVKGIAHLVL